MNPTDAQIAAHVRRCLHELEQNWCDLVNTLSNLVDLDPDVDDFDPATSITHEILTLRNQLTSELEQTAALAARLDALSVVRTVADDLFAHLTSDEPDDTWSHDRAGELLTELAVALNATDQQPDGRRRVLATLPGNATRDTTIDEATAAMLAPHADPLPPPTPVEPATIAEARHQMIHDLHRALYGTTAAQGRPAAAVWHDLLAVVESRSGETTRFAAALRQAWDDDQDAQFAAIDFTRSQTAI